MYLATFWHSNHHFLFIVNAMILLFAICCFAINNAIVRIYVIHLLGTYITILCNWLILWQNAFYLYLSRSRMCLILSEILFQDKVLKPCKSVQEASWKEPVIKARQLSYLSSFKSFSAPWLDSSSTDRISVEVYEKQIFSSVLTPICVYVFEFSFLTTLDI